MAIVSLKRDWFDPEGKLWSARNNPHEMDDALVAELPSDAVVDGKVVDDEAAKVTKAETRESQEQGLAEKKHAAVANKTATPPKL